MANSKKKEVILKSRKKAKKRRAISKKIKGKRVAGKVNNDTIQLL